jgi:NAD-dependent SIR2 family protein deacetylase
MPDHDPIRFAADLGAKLATRSRHVCAFLGAGVGCTCGLPEHSETPNHGALLH